jgi:hypothetical protein
LEIKTKEDAMGKTDKLEIRFRSAEEAKAAIEEIKHEGIRCLNFRVRKSLPDFRGHINRAYSLWIIPHSDADAIMLRRRARAKTLGNI